MRILQVVHGFPPEEIGGTELYVLRLTREQVAQGDQVSVFTGSAEWRENFEVEQLTALDVQITRVHRNDLYFDRWDRGYNPLVAERFERLLRDTRPDIVHVHHWIRLTTNLVATASRLCIPTVVTAHDLYATCPKVFRLRGREGEEACDRQMGLEACLSCVPRWRFQADGEVGAAIMRYLLDMRCELDLAGAIVAPSRSHGEFLCRMLGRSSGKIHTIAHGSLVDRFAGTPPQGADGKIHLACFSKLYPFKGAHVLLEGLRQAEHRQRFVVHLHGGFADSDYEQRLKNLASGLEVMFHGPYAHNDLVRATIDLIVIPTLCRESYSFILDEAVLLGVPILATDAGALAERATDRVLLFRRNDPAALAARLDQIATDPSLVERMRAADPPRLVAFEDHASRLRQLYQDVTETGAKPAEDDTAARLRDLWERREAGFRELVRVESWEDVVAELRARVAELEDAVANEMSCADQNDGSSAIIDD